MSDKYILVGVRDGSIIRHASTPWDNSNDVLFYPDGTPVNTGNLGIQSISADLSFSNSDFETTTLTIVSKTPVIARIRYYLSASSTNVFSSLCDLVAFLTPDFYFKESLAFFKSKLVRTILTSSVSSGDTIIDLADVTDLRTQDLIMIDQEVCRIKSIDETNSQVTIYEPLTSSHNFNIQVVNILEAGGFDYFNTDSTLNLYLGLKFLTSVTEDVHIDIDYRP